MANKRNKNKMRKHKKSQFLDEWRVIKSFGLENPKCKTVEERESVREDVILTNDLEINNTSFMSSNAASVSGSKVKSEDSGESTICDISGRRIVNIRYLLDELKKIGSHGEVYGCTFNNMVLIKEIFRGLKSGFVFECNMCRIKSTVWSEPEDYKLMDINTAAVAGVMGSGGGYSSLQQIMAGLDVRCMSAKTYHTSHAKVSKAWEESALEEMRSAAEEEISMAIQRGDVDRHGTPLLTVVADGSWAKRSYRSNYNSLSGVAAIVGYYTRKVIYIGVKNKYCLTCARAKSKNVDTKEHTCFKNWTGSSCSMESAVIVEGFLCSEEMYGAKYAKLVADGDSSVYHRILEMRPYDDLTVEKVECRNHLLRNYCNRLREIATTSLRDSNNAKDRGLHVTLRKVIGSSVLRLRTAVTKAIDHRKKEDTDVNTKAKHLREDLINGPSHVFGEHRRCQQLKYFCMGKKNSEVNYIPALLQCGLYTKIMTVVGCLADNSKHLVQDLDSNCAEQYNAAVARLIGGKRINYCLKGSYQARCAAAVVSHNSGQAQYKLHKKMMHTSPGKFLKQFEERSKRKVLLAKERRKMHPKSRRRLINEPKSKTESKHYGSLCQKPDMDEIMYSQKLKEHFKLIQKSDVQKCLLEKSTREQSGSEMWREERRLRITASNFGTICNKLPYSNSAPIVTSLLYSYNKDCAAMQYGRQHESTAISELSMLLGKPIIKCGLFIDDELPFLGATPDGLIDEDGIVEVKCPSSGENLTPEEVISQKRGLVGSLYSTGKSNEMKKKHKYYFQIQGQLHITKREYCVFAIWTPLGIKTEVLKRDDFFWEKEMKVKLNNFYFHCLLPELLDPRKRRNMPLREPKEILDAQNARKERQILAKRLVTP